MTHSIEDIQAGGIDGTVYCKCGWSKYTTYPNSGWGRKSVGIRRSNGTTKKAFVSQKLADFYVLHVLNAKRTAVKFGA